MALGACKNSSDSDGGGGGNPPVPKSCTVTFDANLPEGVTVTGEMSPQTFTAGEEQALAACGFSSTGWEFLGWGTTASDYSAGNAGITEVVTYADKAKLADPAHTTLYAKWKISGSASDVATALGALTSGEWDVEVTGSDLGSLAGTLRTKDRTVKLDLSKMNGIETIGTYAFKEASSLKSVTIPACVKTIGDHAFESCSSLSKVTFADGSQLETIGYAAFYTPMFENITIPAKVKTIGKQAFACDYGGNLNAVTFADGSQLETIDENAFRKASKLESITIPNKVLKIGTDAFKETSLSSATFERKTNWSIYDLTEEGYVPLDCNLNDTAAAAALLKDGYELKVSV